MEEMSKKAVGGGGDSTKKVEKLLRSVVKQT